LGLLARLLFGTRLCCLLLAGGRCGLLRLLARLLLGPRLFLRLLLLAGRRCRLAGLIACLVPRLIAQI
jgi:hypothetical protein